jgi:glycerol-3-phosphate dehydrogenase
MARLSKGVHVTVPLPEGMQAALTVPQDRGRVTFAVPWEGVLLLGTTDTPYEGDPSDLAVESSEIDEVLTEAAQALDPALVTRSRVLSSFAGLRVLPLGEGDVAGASREHVVSVGPRGVVSVAGGKLTTHRQIAMDVLCRLPGYPAGRFRLHEDPLPGASAPSPRPAGIDEEAWAHLVHFYGSEALNVLDYGSPERIHPEGPDVWAQVGYALENEWAMEPEDILRRRTTLWYRGLAGEVAERVADATVGRGPVLQRR